MLPRIGLDSNLDVTTVPSPQDGNIVFNTNATTNLPQTVAYFDTGKWNALFTKEQIQSKLDLVNTSSVSSPGGIVVTGFTPGAISLGTQVLQTGHLWGLQILKILPEPIILLLLH